METILSYILKTYITGMIFNFVFTMGLNFIYIFIDKEPIDLEYFIKKRLPQLIVCTLTSWLFWVYYCRDKY